MEKQVTKRSVNWDQDEKDLLSQLVLEKLDVIENARVDTNSNKKKKEAWNAVHILFNKVSKNSRTVEQIQNQWRKTKSVAKSKNSMYNRQRMQTGGGPAPEPLNSVEEELVSRLPKHFESDTNIYDSNSPMNEDNLTKEVFRQGTDGTMDDSISNKENDNTFTEAREQSELKTKIKIKFKNCDTENTKRLKLLDISIKQKELEIKIMEERSFLRPIL